jgi:O-antigen ligase
MTATSPLLQPAYFPSHPAAPIVRARAAVNWLVRLSFYLFVLSIPFEMPNRSIPIEIPTLTGCVFLLITFTQPSVYRRFPGALLWFTAWLWVFGLSTLVNRSDHSDLIVIQFLSQLQLLLILWVGVNILRDRRTIRGTLLTYAFAVAVRAGMQVLHIATTVTPLWTGGERLSVFGQNTNLSAIILSTGFVTILTMRPRLIAWPIAAVVAVALIQTGSRGGLLCAVGGMMVLLLQGRTAWHRVRSILFGLVVLAGLAIGAWRSSMLRNRLEAAATEGSLAGRENIYPAAIAMISEKPWLGWGPTENQYEIAKRIGEEVKDRRDAHNIVLELLSATGILGAIPFLIGMGLCVVAAWRARKGALHMLPLAFLMTVMIGCISGTWIASKILWLAFAIVLGAAGAVKDQEQACAV